MPERYLIDTSIWMDFYEDRVGLKGEPFGDYAFKFLLKIKVKEDRIIVNESLFRELEEKYSLEQINGLFKPFEKLIDKILATKKQTDEALKLSMERNVPKADALYAVIARDEKLTLITRDNHFKILQDLSNHNKPEDLI